MPWTNIQPGQTVAVIGGGIIGQLLVQLVRLAGATTVILATRQPQRRALAEALGATVSVAPSGKEGTVVVVGAAPQQMRAEIRAFDIFALELRILGSRCADRLSTAWSRPSPSSAELPDGGP